MAYAKGHEIATIDVAMVAIDVTLTANIGFVSETITAAEVDATDFSTAVSAAAGTYNFIYDGQAGTPTWELDGDAVTLATYGITLTGTASDGDTIRVDFTPDKEFGLTTGTSASVETDLETTDAIKLIVKGVLIAQKREQNTITGTTITLTDNVFNPELVQILQGGTIEYNQDGSFKKYIPPVAGAEYRPIEFTTNLYTANYDASGIVQGYEKVQYPHCTGQPITFSAEDDTFSAPEYTIKSAPGTGEPAYTIEYVKTLPTLV